MQTCVPNSLVKQVCQLVSADRWNCWLDSLLECCWTKPFPGTQARLSGQAGPGATFSSGWEYELAPLLEQSRELAPSLVRPFVVLILNDPHSTFIDQMVSLVFL